MKIPDYIKITEINNGLIIQDLRTNLATKIKDIKFLDKKQIDCQLEMILYRFDDKYNKSLPIEERKGTNTPTDFYCPYCKTQENNKKIKLFPFVHGGFRYTTTKIIDTYKCNVCQNEFTKEKLNKEINKVDKANKLAILFEQLQDKIITDKEYQDKVFEIKMGMTKSEYEMKKAKEDKEYRQYTRFYFSTKNYFILIAIGLIITIILSIIYPQPNLCEKFGSDWKYSSGGRVVRNACINSNGDIKYTQ